MRAKPGQRSVSADEQAGERQAALAAVARNAVWYHTLELPGGVTTPGRVDLRRVADKLLPRDLHGKRALDVGTFDGFWAFELERRGAEVVAIDIAHVRDAQLPPNNRPVLERHAVELDVEMGRGFAVAAELLGSSARLVVRDVLELTAEAVGGPVDFAFMGALLLHLRDPVLALECIRSALRPGGELYQLEPISLMLSLLHPRRPVARLDTLVTAFNWWYPNRAMLGSWLRTAGFVDIRGHGIYHPPQQRPMNEWLYGVSSRCPA